ncbi:actin-like [Epargyreus clarus]|uniref:actin-like n=1 Tax=Epargyreus clarus TaxID=520877 RepID=UPI003C2D946D
MSFEKPPVVIDNGSFSIKAGFACDNHPVSIFRTIVGRPNYLHGSYGKEYYDVYIGDDAAVRVEDLELSHPVVCGRIVHWDNMERIWHHIFYRELKAAPEDRAVILGCAPTTPMQEKIKCCEIFFEALNSPALCIQPQSVLSLYGSGFTNGICVDLGYDTTDIVPIFEGGLVNYAHIQTGLAGNQISDYIKQQLNDRNLGHVIKTVEDIERIKQDCLYVTECCAVTRKEYSKKYKLPSGEEIDISLEAFMAAELMFQPDLVKGYKTNYVPLHEAVVNSALKCDSELRTQLYDAIVPCGGLAMVPCITKRLADEIENMVGRPVTVLSSSEAYAISWLGGATFAGLPDANKMWVQKKQYEDYGPKIIRNKFL